MRNARNRGTLGLSAALRCVTDPYNRFVSRCAWLKEEKRRFCALGLTPMPVSVTWNVTEYHA
jgi:hypothetical protein